MDKEISMILIIILFVISAVAKAEQDQLNFGTTKIKWSWWTNKDSNFAFWLKVPFSFFENGWHLCDAIRTFSLLLAISILMGYWWLSFILYLCYGIIFELSYRYL